MPSRLLPPSAGVERKRKAHTKSRRGCGNCKTRRVKCDEAQPECKRCVAYGVKCSYEGKGHLDLSAKGAFAVDIQARPMASVINKNMVTVARDSLDGSSILDGTWRFTEKDLEIVKRFQTRTVMTIGTKSSMPTYRDSIIVLAFSHPFLMHMVLSLTLLHDVHLSSDTFPYPSSTAITAALYHWQIGTTLFNQVLSQPVEPSARDALWAAAALMGALVFAFVESTDVSQSWPLKPSDPHDLDWLKLSEGKKAIWKIANPTRSDSIFRMLAMEHAQSPVPAWIEENDLSNLSPELAAFFNLGPESTIENNPYHLPILLLLRVMDVVPTHNNVLKFLYFMSQMRPEYRHLLEIKDPKALLILGWWFQNISCSELWWFRRRAQVEGKAIGEWLGTLTGGKTFQDVYEKLENGDFSSSTNARQTKAGTEQLPEWWYLPSTHPSGGCPVQ